MSGLLYREDMDEVRKRLTIWWNGGDIGRPVIHINSPRPKPLENIPSMPEPNGWVSHYSTTDFAYRVNLQNELLWLFSLSKILYQTDIKIFLQGIYNTIFIIS